MKSTNIPEVKLGIVAVSRDCFPIQLSEKRRAAIVAACQAKGLDLYEAKTTVENEKDMEKAVAEVTEAGCNALTVFLGNFGPETPETLIAKFFNGPCMFVAAAEGDGDMINGRPKRTKSTAFAAGCSFYKIFLLFVIGAFLGDITETIFCRITAGYWMSRSSLVWGPFSIVWGLAIALVTQVLYKYKDRSAFWLFGMGTLLGGAYEYLCSVFTEIVFGAVFWDYSALPFNLGGRINLLYCFFWGLAAVAWFKVLFPPLDRLIESLPRRGGTILTWCLVVFMAVNMIVSSAALIRYDARLEGVAAQTSLDTLLDEHFDDSYMQRVYPKLVHMN